MSAGAPPPETPARPSPATGGIAVILVSWNDADDLEEAVRSLAASRAGSARPDLPVRLVAVGNGKDSVREDRIRALWPEAVILINAENRGLAPAANQGAAAAADAEILLFLNPDTRAVGDPFPALARGFEEHPEASALAPRLWDAADGQPGPPGRRALAAPGREDQFTFQVRHLPRLASDARELLLGEHLRPDGAGRRAARYADADRDRPFPVEQAAAAALAVRRRAFDRIGGFDETFVPAWFEDVDLCARLAPEGSILYWPSARFTHAGGVSSARLGYDRFLPILYTNALRYRRKHYPAASRGAYRLLLAGGMALRLALLPFRRSVPRRRGEAARAYVAVLRLALGLSRANL
ncbi:MAG: glycosyltransferase [Acidobacteria bacterium]|nr:glycosyltransferase [Acidobacteriota bacterium]MCA1610998.1 glycosyltransferase [Acidobacteriota bacterium]